MAAEQLTVEDLLEAQSHPSFRATVEAIAGDTAHVRVTPWVRSSGCLCHLALKIPRSAIRSLALTGDLQACCGKSLQVVQVDFAEGASMNLSELYGQLGEAAARQAHGTPYAHAGPALYGPTAFGNASPRPHPTPPPRPSQRCVEDYAEAYAQCVVTYMFGDEPHTGGLQTCLCNAKNRFCFCAHTCLPQICP